jgi:hypothetical protein
MTLKQAAKLWLGLVAGALLYGLVRLVWEALGGSEDAQIVCGFLAIVAGGGATAGSIVVLAKEYGCE